MSGRLALLALACSTAVAPAARAGLPPCTQAIAGAVEKYAVGKRKAMAKCEDKRSSGKLAASVNCRPAVGPVTDLGTDKKLTKLAAKVEPAISGKCTGPLPPPLPPLGPACDSAATVHDLALCITAPVQDADVEAINVDTLVATVYDTTPPITDTALRKCQAAISKAGGKYLAARMKAKRKCAIAVAAGKTPAPCPDATAAASIEAARTTMQASIQKVCSETQLAADSPPDLTFAPHCRSYKLLTYKRGAMNENTVPVFDRFLRCITSAHAGVADRTVNIGLPQPEASGFVEGVAAGDATDTSAIFWTRVPDATMGATLELSPDPAFASGVQMVSVTPDTDGFVKEDVGSLMQETVYFYRFKQGTQTSAVGRVVTAPDPSDVTRIVHLGWSGDSNAFNRPFTSLDPLRLLAADGWFYIGDTIYGDDALADGLVAMTQSDYEFKYRENRSDAALRGLMESTGTYSQWDDHEVRNDFAGAEPVFATRMAAGNAAFRRYMPLREDTMDAMRLYRSVRWGSGAEFFVIDDRQYRSAKYTCCTNAPDSGFVTTDADSTCTGGGAGEATFPSMSCNTAMSAATRTILGAAQKTWLENGLLTSTATFKFIMNGPPITQLLFLPYDRWEAWSAERTEILDFIVTNGIKNVVWLSTDLHAIVISPTRLDVSMTHAMPEIVAGAIGESTIFNELPPSVEASLPGLPGVITQVSEFELDRYNVVLITVDPTLVTPRANFDFYDRTGSIIHNVFFDAVP